MDTDVFMTEEQNENVVSKSKQKKMEKLDKYKSLKPTPAFIGASWTAIGIGVLSFCIGLWNANLELNDKGYYFTLLLFGLFSVISVQKCVRDRAEGIEVTDIYYGLSWFTTIIALILLWIGLRNADMELSEKGFYGISYVLSLFACVAVQKNIRDLKYYEKIDNH